MMWQWILIPFALQGILIFVDEFGFHVKRGLPKWERIGHPIDTLTVIICFLFILFVPFTVGALKVFIALAVFSCLMITKDEFVHKHHCPASENWLHAVLFVLHPIVLSFAGMIWAARIGKPKWIAPFMDDPAALKTVLMVQAALLIIFFLYQVVFWNVVWREKEVIKH